MAPLRSIVPCLLLTVALICGHIVSLPEQDRWSPIVSDADFSPLTVLEQWSDLAAPPATLEQQDALEPVDLFRTAMPAISVEREDKVMKKPDRIVNRPPNKSQDVSETDLFLLGAIEKLAYRVDFLEKRAKRMEEMIYQLVAGSSTSDTEGEPCPEDFIRQKGVCYHFSTKQLNWKSASSMCRGMGGVLLELQSEKELRTFVASLQTAQERQGNDFWTGGLNPGLLWLWGASAKPVVTNSNQTDIAGNGRCLLLGYQPPTRSYQYRGTDCAARHRYVCQMEDNTTERRLRKLLEDRKDFQ